MGCHPGPLDAGPESALVEGRMIEYRLRDLAKVPSVLSLARIPLAVAFPFVVLRPHVALAVLCASAASDLLDGFLARRLGQETPIGAVVDGLTDKLFVLSVGVSLWATGRLSILALLLLGVRDVGEMAALAVWRIRHGRRPDEELRANLLGKITTVLQFATVVVAIEVLPGVLPLAVASSVVGAAAAFTYHRRLGATSSATA